MPDFKGNRRAPWGQYYHWELIDGKLTWVNGLESQPGIGFSNDPRVWHEPTRNLMLEHEGERPITEGSAYYVRDKDGPVDLAKLQAQHLLFGGSGNALD